jgi:hypothetical protein
MTNEEYEHVDDHLQPITFAWNKKVSSVLETSPFEVMTGVKPHTIADGFVEVESSDPGHIAVPAIRVSAAAFTALAARNADYMRDMHARALNKHGVKLKKIKVDDHVKISVPPGQQEAVRRGRRAKHIFAWRGTMRITVIEGTHYYLEYEFNSKSKIERHLPNIRKWTGPIQAPSPDRPGAAPYMPLEGIEVRNFAMVRDEPESTEVRLGKVAAVTDTELTILIWGTHGKVLKTAVYKPVYANETDVYLHKPASSKKADQWTYTIKLEKFRTLVLSYGFQVQKSGKLSAAAVTTFQRAYPAMTHHRF